MLSDPTNLSHSINGRFSFIEKRLCALQRAISFLDTNKPVDPSMYLLPIIKEIQSDISSINDTLSTINTKDIAQDSYISSIQSDISSINTAMSNLPITMFNSIYPIGCVYSTITVTPPPI